MSRQSTRSPLAHAMGLGSAKTGVDDWWRERVTAVALVPLTVWFAASIIAHVNSDYDTFITWLGMPFTTVMMVLLLIVLFSHAALGLQVVIEDYIHGVARLPLLIAMRMGCFALAVTGVVANLRIALGH